MPIFPKGKAGRNSPSPSRQNTPQIGSNAAGRTSDSAMHCQRSQDEDVGTRNLTSNPVGVLDEAAEMKRSLRPGVSGAETGEEKGGRRGDGG
ncbi:hypothetical protein RUND412_000973 [Rhizina undulata]